MSVENKFIWRNFEALSKTQLYDLSSLRQKVFIIEQQCFYEDLDYSDHNAYHLLVYNNQKMIGYSRVFPPGIKYNCASIGRIVVDKEFRQMGIGKMTTLESISFIENNFPGSDIAISAQYRLVNFYENLGFEINGKVYLEDDIEHIKMVLKLKK